mmetsp:Transcript_24721/g.36900  ORF Transcript_24721/g.36900 Transcript_24721/m.36900 type:complete len:172 (-) Transcript_24721:1209-1724(-)
MERHLCLKSGIAMESWKVRAGPNLLLSGPCALGVSVNEALGKYPLSKFEVGLMDDSSYGRIDSNAKTENIIREDLIGSHYLILMQDKWDLGAMRFTDPERQIVVATTDMPGLSKNPAHGDLQHEKEKEVPRNTRLHYSVAAHGQMVWGSKHVYEDQLVREDQYVFDLHYKI